MTLQQPLEILELLPQGTPPLERNPPPPIDGIKRALMPVIQAEARRIDASIRRGTPSASWLTVRVDRRRHALLFAVTGTQEHVRQAEALAAATSREIAARFGRQVPVEVTHTGNKEGSISLFYGQ